VTANREPNYKRLIAPALAYDAAEARAIAGWVTASFRMGGNALLTSLRAERANPTSVIAAHEPARGAGESDVGDCGEVAAGGDAVGVECCNRASVVTRAISVSLRRTFLCECIGRRAWMLGNARQVDA
jgi:hypothetical protein